MLVGRKINHTEYGAGKIVEVVPRDNYIPLVKVKFTADQELRTFNATMFKSNKICHLDVPVELEASLYSWKAKLDKLRLETEKRKNALAELKLLGDKYHVPLRSLINDEEPNAIASVLAKIDDGQLLTDNETALLEEEGLFNLLAVVALKPLGDKYHVSLKSLINDEGHTTVTPVLIKIDDGQLLTDNETALLKEKGLFNVLATYHYRNYRKNQDPWLLVKASSELRKASLPDKAIEITSILDEMQIPEARPLSALWTTRGGALKDTGRLDEAIRCGKKAITLLPSSFHPYNLLGSIFYEREEFEQGQKYFDQALELGSPARSQEYELRATMKRATPEQRRAIVEFLLRTDPARFSWAKTFSWEIAT